MKRILLLTNLLFAFLATTVSAQLEPSAGKWKTWMIPSVKPYRLSSPPSAKGELAQVIEQQRNLSQVQLQKIAFWNAGSAGYRWYGMMGKLWQNDFSGKGALAYLLLNTSVFDATVAAWDSKYATRRLRPFVADSKIQVYAQRPESPSYPCEYSVAAGAAVAIISHFYPNLTDSVSRMAQDAMASRIAAGVAFPSDTRAGFELGKQIAQAELEATKEFISSKKWDGVVPGGSNKWNGKNPMLPMAGYNRTVVLDSASQFRPAPPPDFAKEMEELRNYKQTFSSRAAAFRYASTNTNEEIMTRKMFEYNLNLNPPRAARYFAAFAVATYDAFTACWDAKYTYWGIRPDQFDPNYKPLMMTPPFPGYPSGHATMSGVLAGLLPYFFPADKSYFERVAKEGAESRFQAGIHFRTDNEIGLELGRKVAAKVIERLKADGADMPMSIASLDQQPKRN